MASCDKQIRTQTLRQRSVSLASAWVFEKRADREIGGQIKDLLSEELGIFSRRKMRGKQIELPEWLDPE